MVRQDILLFLIPVIVSASNDTCPEERECQQKYRESVLKDGEPKLSCSLIKDYLDCLRPCNDLKPNFGLSVVYENTCLHQHSENEQKKQRENDVKLFLDMITKYKPAVDAPTIAQELESCSPLVECITDTYQGLEGPDINVTCNDVSNMILCWNDTKENCSSSGLLSDLVEEVERLANIECFPPQATEENVSETTLGEMESENFNNSLSRFLQASALSPAMIEEIQKCEAFKQCEKMATVGNDTAKGDECRKMIPVYQCVIVQQRYCSVNPETMATFTQLCGFLILYCKTRSTNGMPELPLEDILKPKDEEDPSSCSNLLKCAGEAEVSKIQLLDQETKCSMLRETNKCFQDNIDSCPKRSIYRIIYDENQSEELVECLTGGCPKTVFDTRVLILGIATCVFTTSLVPANTLVT